ncbi:MAG: efflux RND transporter periplasmic adaptor subunit [Tannerellaceae bacterium]|nr:efflux RND transporter periplasmic adaptor subunit [Tannerellaceae bacterium]
MKYFYLTAIPLLLLTACNTSGKEDSEDTDSTIETRLPDMATQVTVATVETGNFYHELISNGKLAARNYVDLYFQSAEPIEEIYVKNGDRVTKGQKLARLSTFRLTNQRKQAANALEQARLEMQDLLIGQGFALEDSLKVPAATMELVRIKSGYNTSLAQYELAWHEERNSVLTAPFDGVVANLFAKPHNIASTAEVFCTLLDNQQLEASFTVLENELPLIRKGDQVEIKPFSMPDVVTSGRITEINPLVDENGMVRVKAEVRNNGKLYEGMNVRISIQRAVPGQLVVPKTAVVLRSGRSVVFTLLPDNKAGWVYVETGLENTDYYTITDGLKEGDVVIISGNINLAHEAPVEIIDN